MLVTRHTESKKLDSIPPLKLAVSLNCGSHLEKFWKSRSAHPSESQSTSKPFSKKIFFWGQNLKNPFHKYLRYEKAEKENTSSR